MNDGVCYPQKSISWITFRWEIFIELCLQFMQIFGNKLGNINSKPFVFIYNIGTTMGHMKESSTTQFFCAAVCVARWKLEPLGPASMQ